jgi:hypothetical protein
MNFIEFYEMSHSIFKYSSALLVVLFVAFNADWTGRDQENSSAEYDYVRFYAK